MEKRYYILKKNNGLWKELENRTHLYEKNVIIENIIDRASQRLDRINEVYPYFTLHDTHHSERVLDNMEKLLGTDIKKLSDIELIILILSAYIHDTGMYYNPDDIPRIIDSDDYKKYLENNPKEFVKHQTGGDEYEGIVNRFCRFLHAERVDVFVNDLEKDNIQLQVDSYDILRKVAEICKTHNQSVYSIKNNNKLSSNFGYSSDLKFCAIILRLSDSFDFDGQRAPQYMYEFLNVENKDNSYKENWEKHICSGGFRFDQEDGNILGFCAEVEDPYIEYLIRTSLDEIEKELVECKELLREGGKRWQEFKLPYRIDRSQIISKDYEYGEYTFTLKKDKILSLFMGEQLYTDNYVFIREILQNAIDTCCYRKYWEESRSGNIFKVPPIEIYDWVDDFANHYIRINDYGMGMSKKIIENYFLKVGESYYRSDDFYAEKIKMENSGKTISSFNPISQFGIGFLSCFLVCDSIEIYTCCRPVENKSSDMIRLSIEGIEDFYTMRLNNNITRLLNKPGQSERIENYGTSIVFRINPEMYDGNFSLEKQVEKYIFCPPVPIIVNNKELPYLNETFIHQKMIEDIEEIELDSKNVEIIKRWLNRKDVDFPRLYLQKRPYDITKDSTSSDLLGQGILFRITAERKINLPQNEIKGLIYNIGIEYGNLVITLNSHINNQVFERVKRSLVNLRGILVKLQNIFKNEKRIIKAPYLDLLKIQKEKLDKYKSVEKIATIKPEYLNEIYNFFLDIEHKWKKNFFKKNKHAYGMAEAKILIQKILSDTEQIYEGLNVLKNNIDSKREEKIIIELEEKDLLNDLLNLRTQKKYYLSYNGVIIPNEKISARESSFYYKFISNQSFDLGVLVCIFALRNRLRPQLNLSRNYSYKLDWEVFSSINLARKQFFNDLNIYREIGPFNKLNFKLTLQEILSDKEYFNEWKKYKIIPTVRGLLSFEDIKKELNYGNVVTANKIERLYRKKDVYFLNVCAYSLLQEGFQLYMCLEENEIYSGKCIVKNMNSSFKEGVLYYPPLFFCEFENEEYSQILCYYNSPLNIEHPFSRWLVSVSPDLYQRHRNFYNAIFRCFEDFKYENGIEISERLNQIMTKLRHMEPKYKIPDTMVINSKHNYIF